MPHAHPQRAHPLPEQAPDAIRATVHAMRASAPAEAPPAGEEP